MNVRLHDVDGDARLGSEALCRPAPWWRLQDVGIPDAGTPELPGTGGEDRGVTFLSPVELTAFSKEVAFKSLQESIDTGTSGGKLRFHIFSALVEFERTLARERTMAGLRAARARGNVGGRPPVMDEKKIQMASHLKKNTDSTVGDICETLGISK